MAHQSKIPDILVEPILQLFAQGKNGSEIKDWLLQEHQIECSLSAITRRLKAINDLRKQATIQEVAKQSAIHVEKDMAIVSKNIDQLQAVSNHLIETADYNAANQFKKTLLAFLQFRQGSGNQSDLTIPSEEDYERLTAKLPQNED